MAHPRLSVPTEPYYQQGRPDVAVLVPHSARSVLDVGCAFGALGRLLIDERDCVVQGIERNPCATEHLKNIYEHFVIGDVEEALPAFAGRRFDCIVFADILEHLVDPARVLRDARKLLAPDGCVVASIPNVRNLRVIYDLLVRGRWRYEDSGIMDRTHLRFFTRTELMNLFQGCGYRVDRIEVNKDRYRKQPKKAIAALLALAAPDLMVCQFRILARPLDPERQGVHA